MASINSKVATFASTLFVLLGFWTGIASGQTCPHQLLFCFGDFYYYNLKNCSTGQIANELACYRGPAQTGCNGVGGCHANSPFSYVYQPQVVGDGPGQVAQVVPRLPANSLLMVPFGQTQISMVSGYPKFIKGQVNGVERVFKVYHVSYNDEKGQRREVRIGHEVTEVSTDAQPITAVSVNLVGKRAQLGVAMNGASPVTFEALVSTESLTPNNSQVPQ